MMKHVTIAGNLITDYVKVIDRYPQQGRLVSIANTSRCVGGCAANTSVGLASIDPAIHVRAMGRVGDDENGQYIIDTLREKGVRCDILIDDSHDTSYTDVMTVPGGERTFFHSRGANAVFGIED